MRNCARAGRCRDGELIEEIREGIGLDDAEVDQEVVGGSQGEVVVSLVGIEIEEGVSGIAEFHDLAFITLAAVALRKFH